jgi:hypothetical protein
MKVAIYACLITCGIVIVEGIGCPFRKARGRAFEANQNARELQAKDREEARKIDLFTANQFHKMLTRICVGFPIRVYYAGALSVARSGSGIRVDEDPEAFVKWLVMKEPFKKNEIERGLFYLVISTKKKPGCLGTCVVGKVSLYIYAELCSTKQTVDDPLFPGNESPHLKLISARKLLDQSGLMVKEKDKND